MVLGFGKVSSWKRGPEEFARRIDVGKVKGFFKKKFTVEPGTKALFIQDGRLSGVLPAGKYDMGGLTSKLKDLDFTKSSTVILTDDGDAKLGLVTDDILTKENIGIGVEGTFTVQIESPQMFLVNFMKGRERVSLDEVSIELGGEIRNILQAKIRPLSVDDLQGNAELKSEVSQDLEYQMKKTLERSGLGLVQLNYLEFMLGEGVEGLQRAKGEVHLERGQVGIEKEKIGLDQDLRSAQTSDAIHGIDSESAVEMAKIKTDQEVDKSVRGHVRGQKLEETQSTIEREEMEDLADTRSAKRALDLKEEMANRKLEREEKRLEMFSKANLDAIMATTDDRGLQEKLAEIKKQEMYKDLSDEQILALAAKDSPDVARAIAEKYRSMASSDRINDQKEFLDRLDRMSERTVSEMGDVASAKAHAGRTDQTIVTGGGGLGGGPVVVAGRTSLETTDKGTKCQGCGADNPRGAKFCIDCGGKI